MKILFQKLFLHWFRYMMEIDNSVRNSFHWFKKKRIEGNRMKSVNNLENCVNRNECQTHLLRLFDGVCGFWTLFPFNIDKLVEFSFGFIPSAFDFTVLHYFGNSVGYAFNIDPVFFKLFTNPIEYTWQCVFFERKVWRCLRCSGYGLHDDKMDAVKLIFHSNKQNISYIELKYQTRKNEKLVKKGQKLYVPLHTKRPIQQLCGAS